MTEEVKTGAIAYMKQTNNCQDLVDRANDLALKSCRFEQRRWKKAARMGLALQRFFI
jgi:hypothetical protein